MQDLNEKIAGAKLTAPEWNEVPGELQNIIEGLGLTLSSGDLNQLGKAVSAMCGSADFYSESGVVDAYVCDVIGAKQGLDATTGLTAVNDGLRVRFRPGNNNTGASTVNVNGTGVKAIIRPNGAALQPGDLVTGKDAIIRWNQASGKFIHLNHSSGILDVTWFGAVGDGVTDDTAAIQATIDAVALTGGVVFLPAGIYIINLPLTMNNSVTIEGVGAPFIKLTGLATEIKAGGSWSGTAMITDQGGGSIQRGMAIRHLYLSGTSGVTNGILWDDDEWSVIEHVFVQFMDGAGVYLKTTTGNVGTLRDVVTDDCVLATSLAGRIGSVTIEWNDCFLHGVTASTSSDDYSESGNRVGILISGATNVISDSVGHRSEDGIVATGSRNRLIGCRADQNRGHGFVVESGSNNLVGDYALRNGQTATNTYDGFSVSGLNNLFTSCFAESIAADPNKHRYGFNDSANNQVAKNLYSNCLSLGHTTGSFNTANLAGAQVDFPQGPPKPITDQDATPSVDQYVFFKTVNTVATTITDFDDAVSGQRIFIKFGDALTTVDFTGSSLKGNGGVDWVPITNDLMECVFDGTNWYCIVSKPAFAIGTLANDATPSVVGSDTWLTGGIITITDFDSGHTGQIIRIISEHAITITDGTNIFLNGSANFVMGATDTLTLVQKADGFWYELSRSVN